MERPPDGGRMRGKMSAQDKTEQVLRDIHLMFANSEVYAADTSKVIVEKKQVIQLLRQLNVCVYELMDEYDLTQRGKDKAEREAKKAGETIVKDASKKAEDVYAASVIYTNEALRRVLDIVQGTIDSVQGIYEKMNEELLEEKRKVHCDQSELKGHLQNLADTEKYLKLIEDTNKEIEKEKGKEKSKEKGKDEIEREAPSYTAPAAKPEIKINADYFERAGIPLEAETVSAEEEAEASSEAKRNVIPEINVNLDAEYFRWKEEGSKEKPGEKKPEEKKPGEKKPEKRMLFSRKDWK